MKGVHVIIQKGGVKQLINLRNVASITLNINFITFYYNFPCVTGENFYAKVESHPAFDSFECTSKEEADTAFESCMKSCKELE